MSDRNVNKILILRFSSLGDIVMATAMIRCLRKAYPQAQIDMAVREDFIELIKSNPNLNYKFAVQRDLKSLVRFLKKINKEKYDLVYDAHRSLRSLFLMPFIHSKYKAYFKKHYTRRALFLTFKIPIYSSKRMLETYVEPLYDYGVYFDHLGPEIHIEPDLEKRTFDRFRLDENRRYIGVIASAQWPGKRWSPKNFSDLIKKLIESTPYYFLLFGGKKDFFCAEIAEGKESRLLNLQGHCSILEAASLIKCCDFVVANDTGLMHVADSVSKPSVLILGPTSKELGCLPFHPKSQIVEKDLWCRPCSKNGQAPCIRFKRECLNLVSVDDVFRSTKALWQF